MTIQHLFQRLIPTIMLLSSIAWIPQDLALSLQMTWIQADPVQSPQAFHASLLQSPNPLVPQPGPQPAPFSVTPPLQVKNNRIYTSNGQLWQGRGVNLLDGFGCDSCGCRGCKQPARSPATLIAWANYFLREQGLDWIRVQLSDGQLGIPFGDSPVFWQAMQPLIDEVGRWPNKYILFGPRHDPTLDSKDEGPTAATCEQWRKVAQVFANQPHVLFEVVGEPGNFSGQRNNEIMANMAACVQTIRQTGANNLVVVPGPQQWARILTPYLSNPIADNNLAYDIHPYGDQQQVKTWMQACEQLPCIVGEFAYSVNPALQVNMNEAALRELMTTTQRLKLPMAGWMGDVICAPIMFDTLGSSFCTFPQQRNLTPWGQLFFKLYQDYPVQP